MKKIILASGSPRRKLLLQQIGLDFISLPSTIEEDLSFSAPPSEVAQTIASHKAQDVARRLDRGIVIGADTLVVWEGMIMGKPTDRAEAGRMPVSYTHLTLPTNREV